MLNYVIEGEGKDVILLHPVGLDLTCWNEVVLNLANRFRILRIDLAGHGLSQRTDNRTELADFAADVHDLLDQLSFGPAAMVGLSFGGMVAQQYVLDYPERITHLVVAACPCTLAGTARITLAARGREGLAYGMASQIEETLQRWFTPEFIADGGAETTRMHLLAADPLAWKSAWDAISNISTAPRLHEIEVPTLCIAGDLDASAPPATLREIACRIKGARLMVLANTPHMMQIEQPELFASAVSSFVLNQATNNIL